VVDGTEFLSKRCECVNGRNENVAKETRLNRNLLERLQ
jgi:hypothetical protein